MNDADGKPIPRWRVVLVVLGIVLMLVAWIAGFFAIDAGHTLASDEWGYIAGTTGVAAIVCFFGSTFQP